MKNHLTFISAALIYLMVFSESSFAERLNSGFPYNRSEIMQTQNTNPDSYPEGFSKERINNLRDDKGNRIIQSGQSNTSEKLPYEDPEGDAMQRKVFNGPSSSSQFGYTVSNAGDVNGDGYDDIIVGAYGYNSLTGRAYIYYGGIIMNTTPDLIMTGEATSNYFGWSVSGAGDINADGYDDVIVGADGYSSDKGRAYVYFGGASMNNIPDMIMTGQTTGNRFATSVSAAGDINGDGFPDIVLGALNFNSSRGKVYVYYGGINPDTIADLTITGESVFNYFGVSVSEAGDFNGDGYSDFIIGASGYLNNTGRSYLFFGGNSPDTLADVIMTGESTGNYFGYSVSSAEDVNGDGFSDVITGAYGNTTNTGKAYIFLGSNTPDNSADVIFTGETTSNYFGISVSSAGDINGDGYSDVIVGSDRFSSFTGKVYIYFGGELMNNIPDVTMTGETVNSHFGVSVSNAGDVNGDGYSDIVCGANGFSSGTGRVYLYDYFMKGTIVQDFILTGENVSPNTSFGYSVSTAGDLNGDGYSDVIVGAHNYSSGTGRAYIYFGGPNMDNIADVTITGETSGSYFGISVSTAGDVNGDGFSDVIIGASGYSSSRGRAYIYFGGSSMNNTADVIMTGDTTFNFFGTSVSTAGDVNGDGYSDVIIGASGYSNSRGRANVYFGGAAMDNVSDVNLFGQVNSDNFGVSVSTAGDMNGDGYSDVIVGANNAGKVYLYFGGSPMNSTSDLTMTSEGYSYFGSNVSHAGDVNGDGYSDIMAASHHPYGGPVRVYIFHGGPIVNNVPDLYMTGSFYFGRSISSAGDINGDGYSDIVIGSSSNSNVGSAIVYYGGAAMDSTQDISMYGDTLSAGFGGSVSAAGDVNGDGYSDLIIGASNNFSKGRAYIYNGSVISSKPILNHVKDVPNDQGGYVELKWARSSYDVNGSDLITNYVVERSSPPSGGNFAWSVIANIPASKNSFYSHISSTPYDSGSGSNGMFYYRITAKTLIPSQYWRSAIRFGRSIDNLAPLMVSPFTALISGSDVRLIWNRSEAPDLLNYILFRSVNASIDPYTETPFANSTDSTFLDTSPLSGSYYYFIIAQDINGNYSPAAVTQRPSAVLNLSMFIEGFYNAGADSQISDTITVRLRSTTPPYSVADQTQQILAPDGTSQLTFGNAVSGNYFLMITHRNSVETWSAGGISMTVGIPVNYNLSSSSSQAYGSNQIQVDAAPVRFAVYSGDVNQDGIIDLADGSLIDNDAFNFNAGYLPTDVNGDEIVDVADAVFADNNSFNFIGKITP